MGVIQGFKSTDLIGRIVFILLLVAELFNWLSMCMSDWGLYDTIIANDKNKAGFGVWRKCGNQEPDSNCEEIDGWRLPWYGAFQAFAIIAFLATNLSLCLMILLMYIPQCSRNKDIVVCCTASCFVTAVFYLVAIIIFGVRFDSTFDDGFDQQILQTGFYFAIVVVVLSLVSGVSLAVSLAKGRQVGPSGGATSDDSTQRHQQQEMEEQQIEKKVWRQQKA
ncbi:hypothetical protein Bpfe_011830 [Biomphalaria pfeifferi]|uniref:Uncharacterized protein n=1 Tax=Biomphalaria pfeifferi TaxID=112525 RepID=A0AAD8FC22_BIOPF|nr:hypothetical protein Bpfe_011830 [Biomphalaria pfeifferi]